MASLYPLQFEPLLKQYLWGGRRLGTLLGKPLEGENDPSSDDWAESWEVVDHADGQSVVANGPLAGKTLADLVRDHRDELLGRHTHQISDRQPRFPLLFKLLDANRTLSVQVHPNDDQAAKLQPPDLGKTEAWVVLQAAPGAKIYAGLREGVDQGVLAAAIQAGACDECLHVIEPAIGECVLIPARTVHALGEGLVIAEIQQSSNTTYRLFDWNRAGKDGRPRPLHIEESLAVTDYERGPIEPQMPAELGPGLERLVECDKFVLDRRSLAAGSPAQGASVELPADNRFHILSTIIGEATLTHAGTETPIPLGTTVLAPAVSGGGVLSTNHGATVLDMYLP